MSGRSPAELRDEAAALGWWYHNIDLGDGVCTSPKHPSGDYPRNRFDFLAPHLPADLSGKSVLDIGCNGGFFCIELKRRGASRVLGIDYSEMHIAQARFAADHLGLDIEYRQLDCYDIASLEEDFDVVVFLGVLYHLRHPLLALDLVRARCREIMLFQTVLCDPAPAMRVPANFGQEVATRFFGDPGYPHLYFVEDRFNGDPSNWWIMNRAGACSLLRDAGFRSAIETDHPELLLIYPAADAPGAEPLAGLEVRSRHVPRRPRLRGIRRRIRARPASALGDDVYGAPCNVPDRSRKR